jgi:hypothetical protein
LENHYRNLLDSKAKIYQGERHDSLISIANSLLFRYGGNGKSDQELKNTYLEINNSRCQPPLPTNETARIWDDALSYYTQKKNEERIVADKRSEETKSSAQIAGDIGNDIGGKEALVSSEDKVSLPKIPKDDAQDDTSNDSDDGNDIYIP